MSWGGYIPGSFLRPREKETITLSRVTWSNRFSGCLSGFLESRLDAIVCQFDRRPHDRDDECQRIIAVAVGDFIHTQQMFRVEGNLFEGERFFYQVESWQPDGYGYSDRRKK